MLTIREHDILKEVNDRYFKGFPLFDDQTEKTLLDMGLIEKVNEALFITPAGKKELNQRI